MGKLSSSRRHGRHFETGGSLAAIDQHADTGGAAAGPTDDLERFAHPPPASHDILDHQDRLARGDDEPPAQHQRIVFLFGEKIAGFGLASHLLPDDEAAHGGREHGVEFQIEPPQFLQQQSRQPLHRIEVLADLGALKIVPAVQPGTQDEVALAQRMGAGENVEDLRLFRIHAPKPI